MRNLLVKRRQERFLGELGFKETFEGRRELLADGVQKGVPGARGNYREGIKLRRRKW